MSQSGTTIYGLGTKTFTVNPGDMPASYPAPRDGEIHIRNAGTNEILLTITVAQVDPILGAWSGNIAACGEPEPGETCVATEPRLFTVIFDSSNDYSSYSYWWTDLTSGTLYRGSGNNWQSTQSGNSWSGSANGLYDGVNRFDMNVDFGDRQRVLIGEFDGPNDMSGTTFFSGYPVHGLRDVQDRVTLNR